MANNSPITRESKLPTMGRGPGGGSGSGRNFQWFTPQAKAADAGGTFSRILRIYMRCGRSIIAAILLIIVSSLISISVPYFIGLCFNLFDVGAHTVGRQSLYVLILIVAVLYLVNWFLTTVNGIIMIKVSQKLVFVLRSEFFQKLQRLPLGFFDTRPHGDTMSRLTNDVDVISSTIAMAATQIISGILTLAGSMVVMMSLSIPLTLTVLISVPLVATLTHFIAKRSRAHFLAQSKSLGRLNGIVEESILGYKMVKAFGRREAILEEFLRTNEELYISGLKAQIWSGYMMPLMNVINNLIFALVAIGGGMLSIQYGLLIGTVVSFLSYSKQFAHPLNAIAGMFNTLQNALAGAERVFEVMDQIEETPDASGAEELTNPKGDVVFNKVRFSYVPEKPVLQNVSFSVKAGQTVALVGETGAGKTTVVNLLTRYYDAQGGEILIDGIPIMNIKRSSLRGCFSVVLQDTCLFSGTIMDNIRYGAPDATDKQVVAAAKLSRAHGFIEKLPKGYNTTVSGSADNLSEGQRQLLAIARAVLREAPILILDEATSSVDTKTEKDIQHALVGLTRSRTSFLIAHRLSTIREADMIMVIGDGKIIESGSHQELMSAGGRYCNMVVSQMGMEEMQG